MPGKKAKKGSATRDIAAENFEKGRWALATHPMFSPLLYHAYILRRDGNLCPKDAWAIVTNRGYVHVHPTRKGDPEEWTYVLAHCLLHLGFGHFDPPGAEALSREWNAACDCAVDEFLGKLKLGRAPHDFLQPLESSARSEERIYAEFKDRGIPEHYKGDMLVEQEKSNRYDLVASQVNKPNWQAYLGDGLVAAVTSAVNVAAGVEVSLGAGAGGNSRAERARAWFINSYPLLGALASAFRIYEDAALCYRMDISVAAVDIAGREIYINPAAGLDEMEMRFVMAHELLHVGLRHDVRCRGRDHYYWNVACFPADTWTGYGQPIQGVATMQRHYSGQLIDIDSQGGLVSCTPEHPFYVRHRSGKSYPLRLSAAEWVEARDLVVGDYLLVPRIKQKRSDMVIDLRPFILEGSDGLGRKTFGNNATKEIPLNEDTAWLIGLYVAEGSSSPKVRFALGSHEEEIANRVIKVVESIGYSASSRQCEGNFLEVSSGAILLGRWLKENCGDNAHTKCIPRVILEHEDPCIRAAFLAGLVQGDGHTRLQSSSTRPISMIGSVSDRLITDVALLLAQDGIGGARSVMRRGPRQIGRSWTQSSLTLHTFFWNPEGVAETTRVMNGHEIKSTSHRWRVDEDGVWYRIRKISSRPFEGEVYNLTTADHTYIANGFLVHNCDYVINAWLVEMGVGVLPHIGVLYDAQFKGQSAEAIYDMIVTDLRRFRKLMTMRGYGASDILEKGRPDWWAHEEGTDLDDFYRRALSQGLAYHETSGRGLLPAGLVEEIHALSQPPIPWDVELAEWFDEHFAPIEMRRTYARPSRRQSSTPDIPRPRWVPKAEALEGRTFGVVLDTSGSMDRNLLGKALGTIASYSVARDVPKARVVFCDAATYDEGYMPPEDIAGRVRVKGRGGTVLQPGIDLLEEAEDFPKDGPILVITDGQCDKLRIRREHAFLLPEGKHLPFVAVGKVFRIK